MKRAIALCVGVVATLAMSGTAWASWQAHAGGAAGARAAMLPISPTSSVVVNGRMATIRWRATQFGNGSTAADWFVWHFNSNVNGGSHYGGVCPPVLGQDGYYSCIDSNLSPRSTIGLWLQSFKNSWTGGFPPSSSIVYSNVSSGPTIYPSPSSYTPGQTMTGSFFGFAPGGTLSFTLNGQPVRAAAQVVPSTGNGTFSIPTPSTATPGDYTIVASDGAGNLGSFAVTMSGPKSLTFPTALTHPGGTLTASIAGFIPGESVVLQGVRPVAPVTPQGGPYTSPVLVGSDGRAQISLTLNQCPKADCSILIWAVGDRGSTAEAPISIDATPPAQVGAAQLMDTNHDGFVDTVRVAFDKPIASSLGWALNAPGYTVSGPAAISGSVVTVPITASAPGTGLPPGGLASNGSVSDQAGNTVPAGGNLVDAANPVPVQINDMAGGLGKMAPGAYFDVVFSEPVTLPAVTATTVTEASPTGSGDDTIDIPGLTNGPVDMGSATYLHPYPGAPSVTYQASLSQLTTSSNQPQPATIRVTLGQPAPACNSVCAGQVRSGSQGSVTFVPSPAIADWAGNTTATAAQPLSARFF